MHTLQAQPPEAPVAPVWLDCDPGNDDAFAILLAAFHPSFNLVGISTLHGNVPLEATTHNTLALLEVLKFHQDEIQVYKGEAVPLEIEPVNATAVHGKSGIGGAKLPESTKLHVSQESYLDALHRAVLRFPKTLCVVCTGPLTNMAKFAQKFPQDLKHIRFVSVMGGSFGFGNVSPVSEFNVRVDPQAAHFVFNHPGLAGKIVLAPLNLTHTALATSRVRDKIYAQKGNNSQMRSMFSKILSFYSGIYEDKYDHHDGPPIHDPLAMFLILPMVARAEKMDDFVDLCDFHFLQRELNVVELGPNIGQLTFKNENRDPLRVEKAGVFVGTGINVPFFWEHIYTALEHADAQIMQRS